MSGEGVQILRRAQNERREGLAMTVGRKWLGSHYVEGGLKNVLD